MIGRERAGEADCQAVQRQPWMGVPLVAVPGWALECRYLQVVGVSLNQMSKKEEVVKGTDEQRWTDWMRMATRVGGRSRGQEPEQQPARWPARSMSVVWSPSA